MNWWKSLKGKVKLQEPLKAHTTFKIGGPADFFIEPRDAEDLRLLLCLVKKNNLQLRVIGMGSNLLISDKGVSGVVLRLNAPYFKKLRYRDNYLDAGAGVPLNAIVAFCMERGLSKAEFLTGIPGTLAGALAMNAGIARKVKSPRPAVNNIGDLIKRVTVMDYAGNIKTLDKKKIKFGYRKSSLSKYIILNATMKLKKTDKSKVREKIMGYASHRKRTQDLSKPSAGCVFKNPALDSAGRLIDSCGLKGKRIKDAGISVKHANFILNLGQAQEKDIRRLMDFIKTKVKRKFNVSLTPEIKIWQ